MRPTRSTGYSGPEVHPMAAAMATVRVGPPVDWAAELGALGGTRTPNLLIRSQMLYPLSYERWCLASLRHPERGLCHPARAPHRSPNGRPGCTLGSPDAGRLRRPPAAVLDNGRDRL